jgi:macrodomain Ter protein organizer (MatP/YcbG family)
LLKNILTWSTSKKKKIFNEEQEEVKGKGIDIELFDTWSRSIFVGRYV